MILEVKNVSKVFGGLTAVNDVTFDLPEGQILGLIGPNGAGKTTLFNCLNGVYPLTRGTVTFRGQVLSGLPTYKVADLGIARTHQIVRPLNELTVRENVMVGACFGRENHKLGEAEEIANEVMEFVGLAARADMLAGSLNVAAAVGRGAGRPERHRGIANAKHDPRDPRPGRDDHHDRAHHACGDERLGSHHRAQLRNVDRRRIAGGGSGQPGGH